MRIGGIENYSVEMVSLIRVCLAVLKRSVFVVVLYEMIDYY